MPTILIRNDAPVSIHGKRPGETFPVKVDDEGVPLELRWRERLREEELYRAGHLVRVDAPAAAKPAAKPVAAPVAAVEVAAVPTPAPVRSASKRARSADAVVASGDAPAAQKD